MVIIKTFNSYWSLKKSLNISRRFGDKHFLNILLFLIEPRFCKIKNLQFFLIVHQNINFFNFISFYIIYFNNV